LSRSVPMFVSTMGLEQTGRGIARIYRTDPFLEGGEMMARSRQESTPIPESARDGDGQAKGERLALVYDELRRVAAGLMRRERTGHTLSPTAVVHEAVIRLLGDAAFDKAADRSYLFASAARAMREVLIDHARRRSADRRGGDRRRVPLDRVLEQFEEQGLDVVAVHEALHRLAELDERQARVMTLRYFGHLTVAEVAAALGISTVTVERDWRLARAWLRGQLRREDE
jgi:RNA polymerase sigma-70 factor, ECF subfamily